MNLFAALTKVEEQKDGTLRVFGIASSEDVDSDGEVTKADAIRKAIPDYLRHGTGALREMHQASAAGVVSEINVGDDAITRIAAHVVDPTAVLKVKTGTYKGFSIGGRVTGRAPLDPREIIACDLVEISLVDRPANPKAVINLWKADMNKAVTTAADDITKSATSVTGAEAFIADMPNMTGPMQAELVFSFAEGGKNRLKVGDISVIDGQPIRTAEFDAAIHNIFEKRTFSSKERREAAASGEAMKDGSYPIKNKDDLHNAIRAVGRGKNNSHAAIRAHIRRRAKALGAESELPEDWKKLEKGMDTVSHMANILCSVDSLLRNSEWEQAMEHDGSTQPDEIKTWLRSGATLLRSIVDEESRELARMSEDDEDEMAMMAKVALWLKSLKKMAKARSPKVGENVRFGGEDSGVIETLSGDKASVRHEKGHLQDFIWPTGARYDEEEKCWMAKRGARHSTADMDHIQGAHDHLVKLGAMCKGEEAEKIGKAVLALPAEGRRMVEALTKVSIDAEAGKIAQAEKDAEAAKAAELAKAASATAAAVAAAQPQIPDVAGIIGREMLSLGDKFGKAIETAVAKMTEQTAAAIKPIAAQVEKLSALPADPKGVTRVIGKADDAAAAATEAERLRKGAAAGDPADPLAAHKAAFANGPDFDNVYDMLKPQPQAAE